MAQGLSPAPVWNGAVTWIRIMSVPRAGRAQMNTRVYRSELTPVAFLRRSAYVFPDKTAVVHGERRYSYREFEERVNRLASALRRAGLAKHDRVAFLCPNIPPLLEAHFAVPAAGGILVAVNTRRGPYLSAVGEVIEMGLGCSSVYLWNLPMFHCNGWCCPWAVTAVAGRHVCLRRVDPGRTWELLDSEAITHYSGAPTVHIG